MKSHQDPDQRMCCEGQCLTGRCPQEACCAIRAAAEDAVPVNFRRKQNAAVRDAVEQETEQAVHETDARTRAIGLVVCIVVAILAVAGIAHFVAAAVVRSVSP